MKTRIKCTTPDCQGKLHYISVLGQGWTEWRCSKCRKLSRVHLFQDELDSIRRSQEMQDV